MLRLKQIFELTQHCLLQDHFLFPKLLIHAPSKQQIQPIFLNKQLLNLEQAVKYGYVIADLDLLVQSQ